MTDVFAQVAAVIASVSGTQVAANVTGIEGLKSAANNSTLLGTSDAQKKEVDKLLTFGVKDFLPLLATKDNKFVGKLHKLSKDLVTSTFLAGNSLTIVDLFFFVVLHPVVQGWKENERVDFLNLTRWFDFVQHQNGVSSTAFPLVDIKKTVTAQPKKEEAPKATTKPESAEKKADTKAEVPAKQASEKPAEKQAEKPAESKNTKKDAPAKEPRKQAAKAPAVELPLDVSRLNIRVGKIVNVKKHESADTLYVEEIDVGEDKPRQVVSGLVNFVPIEEMRNREVVLLCNLKPANLKGVRSEAMVLAASNDDHTKVELLTPPAGSKIGERVFVDGFPGEHDAQLNPKHKVWETVQPELKTNGDLVATYKGVPLKTSTGVCTVKSIANGGIK